MDKPIPYAAMGAQSQQVKAELLKVVEKVIDSGQYILGPEVTAFEQEFADYCGAEWAAGVANGTCSLHLIYRSVGIGPGDEVITAANSFVASASTVALVGAKPVLVDIQPDLNMCPKALAAAITPRTKAILPVHLTGRPAAMTEINRLAKKHNILVVEDAAQAVGAKLNGVRTGALADIASFSLHPLKNLYAFGDAGMVTMKDKSLLEKLQMARAHGFKNRNECEFWSYNCRLDEIQAAMLRIQLRNLDRWTDERRKIAFMYNQELKDVVKVPTEGPGEYCVYQTYVIRAEKRDALMEHMQKLGIDVKIHYPIPIHMQKAAEGLGIEPESLPETMKASREILSLPAYPTLTEGERARVVSAVKSFYGR